MNKQWWPRDEVALQIARPLAAFVFTLLVLLLIRHLCIKWLYGRTRGEGFGLSVRVVSDAAARNTFLSNGSYGWSGAFGTHFWVAPKEKMVAIYLVQTPINEIRGDFENLVMQSIVE